MHNQVPWLGYERDIMPRLTQLAERSVNYTRAYTIASATARSVGPLLAGRYPSEMRRNGLYFTSYHGDNEFVSELAQAAGLATMSAHSHAYFVAETGMAQGFWDFRTLAGTKLNNLSEDNITSERMTQLAKEMLAQKGDAGRYRQFFAYFHFMDPHAPYLPHKGRETLGDDPRDLYDQELSYTDEWVGNLIDWVYEQPFGDSTAVIVTADHGESFGAHNNFKHGYELWEDLVHVPLLIYAPGIAARPIHTARSHIDLAPTILELMGLPKGGQMRGMSLAPELYGLDAAPRPVLCDLPRDNLQDRRRALLQDDKKLIAFGDDRYFMLFDLEQDPEETDDLILKRPELRQSMLARYQELSSDIEQVEVDGQGELKGAPPGQRF